MALILASYFILREKKIVFMKHVTRAHELLNEWEVPDNENLGVNLKGVYMTHLYE